MAAKPSVLKSKPGIKRDGTRFDGEFYTDGQWVRFQRGMPRKIGGHRSIVKEVTSTSRGLTNFVQQDTVYGHSGCASKLERFTLDVNKNSSAIVDRTPVGLTVDSRNVWMFDYAYDPSGFTTNIIAHVAPNGSSFASNERGAIYTGSATGTGALTAITLPAGIYPEGGIVMLHPYLFYFGSDGVVGWSVAGTITDLTGAGSGIARPWGQKFIKGLPLRAGSGGGPSGIFWAYDAVVRCSFVGSSSVFQFDTIASDSSIMSADSVVDYDGVFYWVGGDRFLMFNGVVRELPNELNSNWFFNNVNPDQRSKVFGFKVPRYGEIWWCYPRGAATECTHAVIYNVRENTWYDTELPAVGRSAGTFCNAYAAPILADSASDIWVQEQGTDAIDGSTIGPIPSYFETADLSAMVGGTNSRLIISAIEPDFVQSGEMTLQVSGRANARAPEVYSRVYTFPESPSTSHEQIVVLKEQRRELRVKFSSNCIGGDYQMGQILGHIDTGDHTVLG